MSNINHKTAQEIAETSERLVQAGCALITELERCQAAPMAFRKQCCDDLQRHLEFFRYLFNRLDELGQGLGLRFSPAAVCDVEEITSIILTQVACAYRRGEGVAL